MRIGGYRQLRQGPPAGGRIAGPVPFDTLGLWANVSGGAGLDVHAREFYRALVAEGARVVLAGDSSGNGPADRRVFSHGLVMGLPLFWDPARLRAKRRIGYLVYEGEQLPGSFTARLRLLDRIWTASSFGRDVLVASGLRFPVDVVPGGVDPDVFFPGPPRAPDGPWVVTAIGKPEGRKNYEALVAGYRQAFSAADDVVLKILATGHEPGRPLLERLVAGSAGPRAARIELVPPLPDRRAVAELLRRSDVFALPTHGEGWGLPILEAMACGCCVITTGWSAPRDYVTADTGILLAATLVPARCPFFGSFFRHTRWAEPDRDQLVHSLRWTYEHRAEARAMGARAAGAVRARWTWAHAARRAREVLETLT